MTEDRQPPVLELLPPPGASRGRGDIHARADEYERWLVLERLYDRILNDRQSDRTLLRKAHLVGRQAEERLRWLRGKLSELRSRDIGEVARKARIVFVDSSSWLRESDDPLPDSLYHDIFALAGVEAPDDPRLNDLLQRLKDLDFEAAPLPWEDEL